MIEITRESTIAMAHRLFQYDGQCERLHGHNYRILVTVTSDGLNDLGMVADFADIKRVLFGGLDAEWDHRTILFENDPLCASLLALLDDGSIRPVPFNPTAENMAAHLGTVLFPAFLEKAGMKGVTVSRVVVYETEKSAATWRRD